MSQEKYLKLLKEARENRFASSDPVSAPMTIVSEQIFLIAWLTVKSIQLIKKLVESRKRHIEDCNKLDGLDYKKCCIVSDIKHQGSLIKIMNQELLRLKKQLKIIGPEKEKETFKEGYRREKILSEIKECVKYIQEMRVLIEKMKKKLKDTEMQIKLSGAK